MLFPVQIGPLEGPELFLAFVLAGLVAGSWVYLDASKREDENALLWAAVIAFLFLFYFIVGFAALVIYVVLRGRTGEQSASPKPEHTGSIPARQVSIDDQAPDHDRPAGKSADRDRPAGESTDQDRSDDESADQEPSDR